MRRRLAVLASLTIAVAIAVLLRTASSGFESTATVNIERQEAHRFASVAAAWSAQDCTIVNERAPSMTSGEAMSPSPLSTGATGDDFALRANDRAIAPRAAPQFSFPTSGAHFSRYWARPPPESA